MKKVWDNISLYKNQIIWSPREILDNKCKTKIDGKDGTVGAVYKWEWPLLGEWEMEHKEIKKNESIKSEIRFVKPFKSQATVYYKIGKTRKKWEIKVTWWMEGTLPLFLFWMKGMMKLFISKDYKRGLTMLKTLSETGKLETATQVKWVQNVKPFYWVWIQKTKHISKIGETMWKDFPALAEFLEKKWIKGKKPLAFYPDANMKTDIFTFVTSLQISEKDFNTLEIPAKYTKWYFTGADCFKVVHKWPYDYLSNSWMALYMGIKAHKQKVNKKQVPFEIYTKNLEDGFEWKDLITDIYGPVK